MRVDLFVPYDQRNVAKLRGARWDAEKKTWYVVDVPDLRPFSAWMEKDVRNWYAKIGKLKTEKKKAKPRKAKITGVFTPLCDCDALPWEDCEHTEALAHQAMLDMLA